jgi:hypothetical protein
MSGAAPTFVCDPKDGCGKVQRHDQQLEDIEKGLQKEREDRIAGDSKNSSDIGGLRTFMMTTMVTVILALIGIIVNLALTLSRQPQRDAGGYEQPRAAVTAPAATETR